MNDWIEDLSYNKYDKEGYEFYNKNVLTRLYWYPRELLIALRKGHTNGSLVTITSYREPATFNFIKQYYKLEE